MNHDYEKPSDFFDQRRVNVKIPVDEIEVSVPYKFNPFDVQVGGSHYNTGIQPLEYTMKNKLTFCEGNVVKYISRYRKKNGIEDLAKVVHYTLLAAFEEYGEEGATDLANRIIKMLGVSQ